jgi:hypothetical protein
MRIIKYKWLVHEKQLQPFFITDDQKKIKLLGEKIDFAIGEKHCIGYFSGGRYAPCPADRLVESGWNCNACRLNDDFFMCIKCTGEECANKRQRASCEDSIYFVYLAAFGDLIKVGISHERRLLERLVEQGADFGAKVACVKDGKAVRGIEQSIQKQLGIVDFVRGESKQNMIFSRPNISIPRLFSAISALRTNGFAPHMVPPEIYDLRDYYNLKSVEYNPEPLKIGKDTKLSGDVVTAKGNVLIIKDHHRLYSINAHDMIGRDIQKITNG